MSNVYQNLKPYKSERSFQIERFTSVLQRNFVKGGDWKYMKKIWNFYLWPLVKPNSQSSITKLVPPNGYHIILITMIYQSSFK
jgi:hypothetical protein